MPGKTKMRRELTDKERLVIEGRLAGKSKEELGMMIYNTTKPKNAHNIINSVMRRPLVRNEIEQRMRAQQIFVDEHLKNINKLAFGANKEDIRLRASQDLADRAGIHYKYFADEGKVDVNVELTDEQFDNIINKYKPNGQEATGTAG